MTTYSKQQAYYGAIWEAGGRIVIEPRPLRAVKLCRRVCPSCGAVYYDEEAAPRPHRCRHYEKKGENT